VCAVEKCVEEISANCWKFDWSTELICLGQIKFS